LSKRSHGSGLLLIERRQFLQDLYDTLPEKTRIKTSCTVLDIKQDDDGVEVILANGEVERGDLVLGCDGVYSFVRRILWEHANRKSPGLISVDEKRGRSSLTINQYPLGDEQLLMVLSPMHSHQSRLEMPRGHDRPDPRAR
jgi:2-polyprenyl-6-methoxyphenol hydroxylase-like FAD-dependent oxidoreductase